MSDDLSSKSFELVLEGKTLQCGHVTAADRAALRDHIRQERIRAILDTCKQKTLAFQTSAVAQATAQPVPDTELLPYMGTEEGMQFLIWRGLRSIKDQESWTLDHVRNVIEPDMLALIASQLYSVSGYLGGESDATIAGAQPNYDKEIATVVRYYGLSLDETEGLTPRRLQKLFELIPQVAKQLGETSNI